MRIWRAIETAPMDWTDVLLFDAEYENDFRKVFEGYYDPDLKCWRSASSVMRTPRPTHWMPLPEPPK